LLTGSDGAQKQGGKLPAVHGLRDFITSLWKNRRSAN
jgi:hypothetical protein